MHEDFTAIPEESLLAALVPAWIERGVRVSVLSGPSATVEADAVFCHVDLTRTPPRYVRFAQRFPVAINGRVEDISKRRISRQLVRRGDGYGGPVIVKTNLNYGGYPEARAARRAGPLRRLRASLRNLMPWSWRAKLRDYPTYDSAREVPAAVWLNPDLVVERFLPERRDGRYWVRTWLFLGDRERMARFYSDEPVVKSDNILGREPLDSVPDDLRRLREELGFDYGKFDFAVVDGRTVLYDANRTPSLAGVSRPDLPPWLGQLAGGLWSLLGK